MKRQIALASAAIAIAAMTAASIAVATNDRTTGEEMMSNATKIDDLRSLSARFDRPEALQGWRELQVEGWVPKWEPPKVENGQLVLQPKSSGWFEDNKAGHLYQQITGDFIVTTRLKVQGTNASLPQRSFSLAGLFIRAPRTITKENWTPKGENWLFFSIGTAFPAGSPHFEIKSTYNSVSTLKILDMKFLQFLITSLLTVGIAIAFSALIGQASAVHFPANYQTNFFQYATVDCPKSQIVRKMYVNREIIDAIASTDLRSAIARHEIIKSIRFYGSCFSVASSVLSFPSPTISFTLSAPAPIVSLVLSISC
jgi:hypothetical protein